MPAQKVRLIIIFSALVGALFLLNSSVVLAQVKINEFSSYETANDWIEFYATEKVNISNWIIRDSANSIVKTLPEDTWIGSNSAFLVVNVGNRLNRDRDTIKLLKADDKNIEDQLTYGEDADICAPQSGQSSGRNPDGGETLIRFANVTQGATNNSQEAPCPTPSSDESPSPSPDPSPTPSSSTPSPSPSPKPTLKPSPSPTPSPSESPLPEITMAATESGEVLGTTESAKPKNPYLVSIVLSLLGIVLAGGSGLGFYLQSKKV